MSYTDHARGYLAACLERGQLRGIPHEINEINEKRGGPSDAPEAWSGAPPVVAAMAAVILAFTPAELLAFRAELADFPADDPPSEREFAALALADHLRKELA